MTITKNSSTTAREPLTLADLPIDVLPRILAKSSEGTVLNLALKNSMFHAASQREETWKRLHDAGSWKPSEEVRDIIESGSYREAFLVQVKDAKGTWEKLEGQARTKTKNLDRLPRPSPVNRGGCAWTAVANTRGIQALSREIADIRKKQAAIVRDLESDHLAFVPGKER